MPKGEAPISREARIQEMLDHYEITKAINSYCHACDRFDQIAMAATYAQESWDDHGPHKCPGPEFARRVMTNMSVNANMCSHHMGQTLIKVEGDEAGAESYFLAVMRVPNPTEGEVLNLLGGRFVDTLVREDEEWKIKRRIAIRDWSGSYPVERDWIGPDFVRGQRSGADPSFETLGLTHSGIPDLAPAIAAL